MDPIYSGFRNCNSWRVSAGGQRTNSREKPVRCLEIQIYSGFFVLYMYLVMVGYKIFLEGGQKMAEVHDLFGRCCGILPRPITIVLPFRMPFGENGLRR